MKMAISLPDEVFHRVDAASKRMGISRSEFFRTAAERWLRDLNQADITEAINDVLGEGYEDENEVFLSRSARLLKEWH